MAEFLHKQSQVTMICVVNVHLKRSQWPGVENVVVNGRCRGVCKLVMIEVLRHSTAQISSVCAKSKTLKDEAIVWAGGSKCLKDASKLVQMSGLL